MGEIKRKKKKGKRRKRGKNESSDYISPVCNDGLRAEVSLADGM